MRNLLLVLSLWCLVLPKVLFSQNSSSIAKVSNEQKSAYYKKCLDCRNRNDYDSALYYNDLLLEATPELSDTKIIHYYQKIETHMLFSKTAEAYELAIRVKEEYCNSDSYCDGCTYINGYLSDISVLIGDYEKALDYLNGNCETVKDPNWYYNKAKIQVKLGLQRAAIETVNQGISDLRQFNNSSIKAYNNAGLLFRDLGLYEKALSSHQRAISRIEQTGELEKLTPTVFGNIGYCYGQLEKYDSAYVYLLKDVEGSYNYENWSSYSSAMLELMLIDSKLKNYQAVLDRGRTILNNEKVTLPKQLSRDIYFVLTESCEELGDASAALMYHKKYANELRLNEESLNQRKQDYQKANASNAFDLLESKMELQESIKEKQLYATRQRELNARFWTTSILISSIFLISLIVLFVLRYRSNSRKKQEIDRVQLDLAKKEQVILKMNLDKEKKAIQELCLELTLKSDFAENLSSKLAEMKEVPSSTKNEVEMFVNNELLLKTDRAKLGDLIHQTGEQFYGEIQKRHPNLTRNDLELSLMIQLKMSNKEIAIKRNITPASVKIAKNRLKKKLNLSAEQDLKSYVEQFGRPS